MPRYETIKIAREIYQKEIDSNTNNNNNTNSDESSSTGAATCRTSNNVSPSSSFEWSTTLNFEEARQFFGKSFANNNDMWKWTVNHIDEWKDNEEYEKVISFGLGLSLFDTFQRNPLILVKRDMSNTNNKNNIVAAAMIVEYEKSFESGFGAKIVDGWRFTKSLAKVVSSCTLPDIFLSDGGGEQQQQQRKEKAERFERKTAHLNRMMKKVHNKYGPKERHWYVSMIASVPPQEQDNLYEQQQDEQNETNNTHVDNHQHDKSHKDHLQDLVDKIGQLADKIGVLCYMETSETNNNSAAIFARQGFQEYSKLLLEDPNDGNACEPCNISVMVRKPNSCNMLVVAAPRTENSTFLLSNNNNDNNNASSSVSSSLVVLPDESTNCHETAAHLERPNGGHETAAC